MHDSLRDDLRASLHVDAVLGILRQQQNHIIAAEEIARYIASITDDPQTDDGNVVYLPGDTDQDIPPDRVLMKARGRLSGVVIIGAEHHGVPYYASSISDKMHTLWMVERFKQYLLDL